VTEMAVESGAERVEIRHHRAGRYQTVRVLLDKAGGITVSDCAKVSRRLSADLDILDLVDGRYTLEVSSPGLDRPLRTPAEFRRKIGRKVTLEYREGDESDCTIAGTIDRVDDVSLTVAATTVDWSQVVEGKLVI
ncbi:MAG: ribosome maturation factor RimP, partial [Acidobacteria bacterium]|nr:ribosome maturation factor RimP [Acidobacteriota bacterium]